MWWGNNQTNPKVYHWPGCYDVDLRLGRLSDGEKDFIIYLLEHGGSKRADLDNELGYAKSSITRFIDSLSNQGIIEFNRDRRFVLADKMLEMWLKIKHETMGFTHYKVLKPNKKISENKIKKKS